MPWAIVAAPAQFVAFSSAAELAFAAPVMDVTHLDLRGMRRLDMAEAAWVSDVIMQHWPDVLHILVGRCDPDVAAGLRYRFGTRVDIE